MIYQWQGKLAVNIKTSQNACIPLRVMDYAHKYLQLLGVIILQLLAMRYLYFKPIFFQWICTVLFTLCHQWHSHTIFLNGNLQLFKYTELYVNSLYARLSTFRLILWECGLYGVELARTKLVSCVSKTQADYSSVELYHV